ncbi:uncharacterized protein M421DRAFT_404427 [Didymella exigua CBS 183.55]|uniref:Uncharacterized protein n=1 Tax=Didymella exigua CBS 183.55 TaxID=1150837 RepID=A0A6A5R7B2_9PLEO|nr:uncharacterized protein M421DRAFT_404427 [Didymella exigua CBS 183.55]KAF1924055.1 hypothetical protein M421DRAFT_404427 [Didymella exigua CBS 183.55]
MLRLYGARAPAWKLQDQSTVGKTDNIHGPSRPSISLTDMEEVVMMVRVPVEMLKPRAYLSPTHGLPHLTQISALVSAPHQLSARGAGALHHAIGKDKVSRNYGSDINCELSPHARQPIVVGAWGLQLEENVVAIAMTAMAGKTFATVNAERLRAGGM